MCRGVSHFYLPLDTTATQTVAIPLDSLPTGVNQLTLFDSEGRIHADRLFFVNHHDHDAPRLAVSGIRTQYEPFDSITLRLQLSDPADSVAGLSLSISEAVRDRLQHESRICDYFPSYEILMDDLRDYRFYDTDLTHPSASAITYISELLAESYLTPESREIASQGYKLYTAMNHRPNTGDTDGYKAFLQNTLDRVVRFGQAYPYINMTHEITELNTRINQI